MSVKVYTLLVLISALFAVSLAAIEGKRTLVLVDDLAIASTHSIFFDSLKERGYTLDFSLPNNGEIQFESFGEFQYDNLIIFSPKSDDHHRTVRAENILRFIDEGGDVLLAGDSDFSREFEEIGKALGLSFGKSGSYVIDHLNFDSSDVDGQHTLIVANHFSDNTAAILRKKKLEAVLYQGTGFSLNPDNTLVFPLIQGSPSSYVHKPDEPVKSLNIAGTRTTLVAALQARNNARVAVTGSVDMFSNAFLNSKIAKDKTQSQSGNLDFVVELSKWTFHERGLLRLSNVNHHKKGDPQSSAPYTIKEFLTYSVDIEEWNGESWVPYSADDVQLEFQMLDPYVRINLEHDKKGHYTTTFQIPDVYGVYTLKLSYFRLGYTSLESKIIATVRPLRHDQYERFIPQAYPYYASAFSMMAAVVLFSAIFLYNRDK